MKPTHQTDRYTLYHGDCLDVLPTLEAGSVDAVISDPPYGVDWDTDYTRFTGGAFKSGNTYKKITNDKDPFNPAPFLNVGKVRILWGANCYANKLPSGSWLVWDKRYKNKTPALSDGEIGWVSEGHGTYIFSHFWDGFLRESERGEYYSATQKPVALWLWALGLIAHKIPKDATVIDPYMGGSGSVGLAALQMGYKFIGIEIDDHEYNKARQRIANAAGDFCPAPRDNERQMALFW